MTSFSERYGFTKPQIELSIEEMPKSLRDGLWDAVTMSFFQNVDEFDIIGRHERMDWRFDQITDLIWFQFFRESLDHKEEYGYKVRSQIKERFFSGKFHFVYDFIEFMAALDTSSYHGIIGGDKFREFCNNVLLREKSAVRFVGGSLVQITNQVELNEVEQAMSDGTPQSVANHIVRSAQLFGQRPIPDYRNSVKESISAIESAVRMISGTKSIGVSKPLRNLLDTLDIHPALVQGFEKIYAYTSDESGVRHSLLDRETVTHEEAKFMLVACSAFANYLISKKG